MAGDRDPIAPGVPSGRDVHSGWAGTGGEEKRAPFTWNALLWSMVCPRRGHRLLPTVSGTLLIAVAFGIGAAAYNSSNNILFITLSLLLSCLLFSGLLSWLNLRKVLWRLRVAGPLRAGHDAVVTAELRNGRRFLPAYGLWLDFTARSVDDEGKRAESTFTARAADIRAALAAAERGERRARLPLADRIAPKGEAAVEWVVRPERRGRLRVELAGVASLFPFGFLRKDVGAGQRVEAVVWPAPVEYRRFAAPGAKRRGEGERERRAGGGSDLLALRRYAPGDSHRLVHWKASARSGTLLVRQFAAESTDGCSLWIRTDRELWPEPERFELLVGFAATYAEDLFRQGRLRAVALDREAPRPVRGLRDLEDLLDRLALAVPAAESRADAAPDPRAGRGRVVVFAAEGPHGVAAFAEGIKVASA
ncbi:MAG: DUF58 domain-containing protein [Opitutaceae bacterium]